MQGHLRGYRMFPLCFVCLHWLNMIIPLNPNLNSSTYHLSSVCNSICFNLFLWLFCLCSPLVTQMVKHLPSVWETRVQSLGREDTLEKEMATHSSTLAWKIPWPEEPLRLTVHGVTKSQKDWPTSLSIFSFPNILLTTFSFSLMIFPSDYSQNCSIFAAYLM